MNINMSDIRKNSFVKTAIFLAVFLCFTNSNAQEYNNWLLGDGNILNFNTSPATVICNEIGSNTAYNNYTVSLSDDNGKLLLYGYYDNTTQASYVIKNSDKQEIVRVDNPNPRNVIACKLPQGGYCIAAVFQTGANYSGELYIYQFDKNAKLDNEYIYHNMNYSFFLDFLHFEDFVVLVSYRDNQIETYKLTSEKCVLWAISDLKLDKFLFLVTPSFNIEHTLDNTQIIATTYDIVYVLNFDKSNGKIKIAQKFENNKFRTMSFSPTDKYFLIIDDDKLKGFRYDKDFDFVLDNPDIIYDLPKNGYNVVCNQCWEMAVGVDNKIYIHEYTTDYLIVLDGIESENIKEEIIQCDCLKHGYFPRIPRMAKNQGCTASAQFDNASVCYGEPLKVMLSGTAPFEVDYTMNGEAKSFKTDNMDYQMDNIPGKYNLIKVTDANGCNFLPINNNIAIIAPKLNKLTIKKQQ